MVWDCALNRPMLSHGGEVIATRFGTSISGPSFNGMEDANHLWVEGTGYQNHMSGLLTDDCTMAWAGIPAGTNNKVKILVANSIRKITLQMDTREIIWDTGADGNNLSGIPLVVTIFLKTVICTLINGVAKNIYFNGNLLATAASSTETFDPTASHAIQYFGGGQDKDDAHMSGANMMGCIWNRALSTNEIALFADRPFGMITPFWEGYAHD